MFRLPDDQRDAFRDAVNAAADRAEVSGAVGRVYDDFAGRLDALAGDRPACGGSGACCRFEAYGHRLFVTTAEVAAFARSLAVGPPGGWDGTGCPFQVDGACGVHAIRPFGCRVYFCDPSSTAWQEETYEELHADLRRLHDDLDVPYHYVEWRDALSAAGLAEADSADKVRPRPARRLVVLSPGGRGL